MTSLVLLVTLIACVAAAPHKGSLDNRLGERAESALSTSTEAGTVARDEQTRARPARKQIERVATNEKNSRVSSTVTTKDVRSDDTSDGIGTTKSQVDSKERVIKKGRKHKAIFVNYPFVPHIQPYPKIPSYNSGYEDDYDSNPEQRTSNGLKRYQESNIFYIRLPPTPYMFVPGLGYISQPPTYSTAGLVPQFGPMRPVKHQPVYHRPVNPFIKLPIDFVSNGKPTSVYQWQKKPAKRPTDSPITNLDNLSADFVSNGKPTSIYQWSANAKPTKRPDDLVNSLDKGPYVFNGRPTSLYLLRPDGSTSLHQPIRYPEYEEGNNYY